MASSPTIEPSDRRVRSGEWHAVTLSFTYFFCVLAAYYVIRPVREQLSAAVGSTQLPWFYGATFLATLALTRINFVDDSYPGRDADEVIGLIKRWRRLAGTMQADFKPFDVILLSLGGNDVIGLDFDRHLKPGNTPGGNVPWPWNAAMPQVVRDHVRLDTLTQTFQRIADAYALIIDMRDDFAPNATIITHTYADVTPSDTDYEFLTFKAGPWISKPATKLGISANDQKVLVRWLLESFRNLLLDIQAGTTKFVVLDTRLELPAQSEWDNEIHPRGPGFRRLVDRFWRPAIEAAIA